MSTNTKTVIDFNAVRVVDELGQIKAQIANLKDIEKKLVADITAFGPGAYEGVLFRASVSEVSASSSLDPKAAEAKLRELGVDGRWFTKHQKVRAASTAVRVVARSGE